MDEAAKRVWEIIDSILYINIATVSEKNEPWNTPVYAVHDGQPNFFWRSWIDSQHSQNIRANLNVFMTVYDTTRGLGQNHQRCVYIKAKAIELNDQKEIEVALSRFANNTLTAKDFMGGNVKRVYKATPEEIWLNDKSESQVTKETVKMRIEVPLDMIVKEGKK